MSETTDKQLDSIMRHALTECPACFSGNIHRLVTASVGKYDGGYVIDDLGRLANTVPWEYVCGECGQQFSTPFLSGAYKAPDTHIVYIVDDDPFILRATARALKGFGWLPSTFDSIESMRKQDLAPDVILTDWDPSGPEIVKHSKVPVVVFTGDVTQVPIEVRDAFQTFSKNTNIAAISDALHHAAQGGRYNG